MAACELRAICGDQQVFSLGATLPAGPPSNRLWQSAGGGCKGVGRSALGDGEGVDGAGRVLVGALDPALVADDNLGV